MAKQQQQAAKEVKSPAPEPAAVKNTAPAAPAPAKNNYDSLDREQKKELQKLQRQFAKLEEEIAQLHAEKTRQEQEMGNPDTYSDKQKFNALESQYKNTQQKLAAANQAYETLFEKIMELEK
jgi:ATP-binding cassette subfamily F protein 3